MPCHYTFLACCEADSLSLKQSPKSRLRSLLAGDFWTSGSKNKKFEPAEGGRFDGVLIIFVRYIIPVNMLEMNISKLLTN